MDQLRPVELRLMDSGPIAQEWLERAMAIEPDDNLVRYNVACTYSLLGETDGAIKLPEICLKQFGTDMKEWIKNDTRSHPGSSGNQTLLAPY